MEKNLAELKNIVSVNKDLKERVEKERWSISYNRKADMVVMGTEFPVGSSYYPLQDTGVLIRIDKDKKICGFAIENTKSFIKQNPEIGFALSFFVYPVRSIFFKLPYYFVLHQALRGIEEVKGVLSVSNYVAGRATFAS